MLAIVMAGIAGLFIVAIVAAYNYTTSSGTALDSNPPASAGSTVSRLAARDDRFQRQRAATKGTAGKHDEAAIEMKSTRSLAERRKTNSKGNAHHEGKSDGRDQGVRKDERGQEQPTDRKRALKNR